jgi:peptidoglycan/LPS O-acetylase OafA/YrhL
VTTSSRAPARSLSPAGPAQLDALTGIRGIAAWFVVLFHARVTLVSILPGWAMAMADKGYLAVDLFFMLSGFVLWYNYAPRLRGGGLAAARSFWWRRFARIWPLHGLMLAACVAWAIAVTVTGRDATAFPFAQLPLHVLLIQNWGFSDSFLWNVPAWSISTEQAVYIVFPLAVAACRWDELPTGALAALAGALLAGLWALFAAHGYHTLGFDVERLGLGRCLFEFALGNLMCMLWRRWRDDRWPGVMAALACGGLLAAGAGGGWDEIVYVPAAFFTGLLALALARGWPSRLLGTPVLRDFGEISYSTYLSHYLLFIAFKLMFVHDPALQVGWLGLIGYFAMVFAASVILYHGVEKPAQRWLNAHGPGGRRRAGSIASPA